MPVISTYIILFSSVLPYYLAGFALNVNILISIVYAKKNKRIVSAAHVPFYLKDVLLICKADYEKIYVNNFLLLSHYRCDLKSSIKFCVMLTISCVFTVKYNGIYMPR